MNRKEIYLHESLYRGDNMLEKFQSPRVTVCGAGSLGANLTESLARQGFAKLTSIDRDRVEIHNISNQPYLLSDVGAFKTTILTNFLYRAVRVELIAKNVELNEKNCIKLLKGADLVVDTFDNSTSRQIVKDTCLNLYIPCLHLGMSGDGYGEVIWNENYQVPNDQVVQDDPCNYPMARNIVTLVVAIGCEVITKYILDWKQENYTITLKDLSVQKV